MPVPRAEDEARTSAALPWADADRARIGAPGDPGWLEPSPSRRRWMASLWPGFVAAALIETLVFAAVDPAELSALPPVPEVLSVELVYTAAFFAFWAICSAACALSNWLASTEPSPSSRA